MKNTERSASAPFVAPLPDWGLIHATGADAQSFLHGQFTNDMLALAADGAQWNGYCSAKGRLYAAFLVWRDGGDGFYLAAERALLPGLVKRLRMFVLRAKVVLEDVSASFHIQGLVGPDMPAPMSVSRKDHATLIGLPPVHGVARSIAVSAKAATLESELVPGTADDWQRLMIHAGEVWITPATQEQFVPQMVNLDAIGAINFKKGCYPGQEIVARAHYRGAVKRRAYLAHVEAEAKAGDALFATDMNGQESGLVANAAPAPGGGSDVLAVIQIQSHAQAQIHLGAADGPQLHFAELPYTIPAAA
ncbi:MAG: ygfZ [Betaproteobacteria bacterium]|nr:ygfZ [Betaproteobacteria bacterium]